eukprot:CAMPEP_0117448892 /NCGR_PEP_ID=MMETSP0759-20121206/7646_1 /TAXON_ID=63605 /ORGANISM="Percolomonas cosmopolitus, Strain WS" /LENGTH=506 /DNA_ID=CAMNT_0005241315 /DNA_START=430 /DNA_END=1950 /DNA_ORIENTATION=-
MESVAPDKAGTSPSSKRTKKSLKMPCSLSRIPLILLCTLLLAHVLSHPLTLIVDLTNKNLGAALGDVLKVFYMVESFGQACVIFIMFPALIVFCVCYDPLRKGGRAMPPGSATGVTPGAAPPKKNRIRLSLCCLRQCCTILFCTCCVNIVVLIFFGVGYPFFGFVNNNLSIFTMGDKTASLVSPGQDGYRIVFPLFYQAVILIPSYLILIPTLAVGISSIPLSFLASCLNRPTRLRLAEYQRLREYTKARAEQLMIRGAAMEDRQLEGHLKPYSLEYIKFKREVQNLKEEWESSHFRFAQGGISVWKSISLVIGLIVTTPLSLVWILHIALYACFRPAQYQFFGFLAALSDYADRLTALAPNTPKVPLVGAAIMTLFMCYLMWCIVSGFFKLLGTISLLYLKEPQLRRSGPFDVLGAVMVLYACAPALKQYCFYAFEDYFESTTIASYFGSIEDLDIIGYIYPYWIHVFILMFVLGVLCNIVFMFCCRKPTNQEKTKSFVNAALVS